MGKDRAARSRAVGALLKTQKRGMRRHPALFAVLQSKRPVCIEDLFMYTNGALCAIIVTLVIVRTFPGYEMRALLCSQALTRRGRAQILGCALKRARWHHHTYAGKHKKRRWQARKPPISGGGPVAGATYPSAARLILRALLRPFFCLHAYKSYITAKYD